MAELKPCPFCGGEAVVTKHHNRFTEWYLCSSPNAIFRRQGVNTDSGLKQSTHGTGG